MEEKPTVSLDDIRAKIVSEVASIDKKPYSDAIISEQLQAARRYFGEAIKNVLIDELGLEKYGWHKEEGKIRRSDKYSDSSPLI